MSYDWLFRVFFQRIDPERIHGLAHAVIGMQPFRLSRPTVPVSAMGLTFPSPLGVAAGFDKNADGALGLGRLGFGHVEVGTITVRPQPGNPRPRLFRLTADRALINRMGFNNHGAEAAARVLARARRSAVRPVIGVNIGKNKDVDPEDTAAVIENYLAAARLLAPLADYLAVNVSSPNTPGLRGLQDETQLRPLLTAVLAAAGPVPLLVKIAPDMDDEQVAGIARLAAELGLAGVIATNTTVSRAGLATEESVVAAAGAGGLSGAPLADRALAVLDVIRVAVPDPGFTVISVGGVETAEQVRERQAHGATLVQAYTAFIYQGPFWARRINRELAG